MKKAPKILLLAFFTIWMITFAGCKKDAENPLINTPIITTASLSTITTTSAETGGNVTSGGGYRSFRQRSVLEYYHKSDNSRQQDQ